MSPFIPGSVQSQYDRVMSDGLPGSPADANPVYKETFIAEGGDIPYGVVVSRGTLPGKGRIGKTGYLAAAAGYAIGTGTVDQVIANWKACTGATDKAEFTIAIDGAAQDITGLDLVTPDNLTAVAAAIQVKLRAVGTGGYSACTVTYSVTTQQFTITSGTTGVLSSVSDVSAVAGGTGTDISTMMGMDTAANVVGTAATSLRVLGINYRILTHESASLTNSGTVTVKEHETGAVQRDGAIKVLAKDSATDGTQVYFDDANGEIWFASASGRTALGTSKLRGTATAGKVAIIDILGVR